MERVDGQAGRADVVVKATCLCVGMIGMLALIGWLLDLQLFTTLLGDASTKLSTAMLMCLSAGSLWLYTRSGTKAALIAAALAAVGFVLATLSLAGNLFHQEFSFTGFVPLAPGSEGHQAMATGTALSFSMIGIVLMRLRGEGRSTKLLNQGLSLAVLVLSYLALVGYIFNKNALDSSIVFNSMSLNTALAVLMMATGMLAYHPRRGLAALVLQRNHAGQALRRLLPLLVVTPIAIGWIRLFAQRSGYVGAELGIALMVTSSTLIVSSMALWNAHVQGKSLERQETVRKDEAFLLELGELLRSSATSEGLLEASAQLMQQHLHLSRCEFSLAGSELHSRTTTGEETRISLQMGGQVSGALLLQHDGDQAGHARIRHIAEDAGKRAWLWYLQVTATEARQESEELLSVTLESIADAVVSMDVHGLVVHMNASAEQLTGWSRNEASGLPSAQVIPIIEEVEDPAGSFSGGQHPGASSATLTTRSGDQLPVSFSVAPIRNASTEILGNVMTFRDISAQKRSMESFHSAVEASPSGMIMVDQVGEIVLINRRAEELFGYSRTELIGQRVEILVPEPFAAKHSGLRMGYAKSPTTRAMGAGRELFGLHKSGGVIPIEIGLNPVETSTGAHVLVSIDDISEKKRAFEQRITLDRIQYMNKELEERVEARTSELRDNLREREILLQEVHHRVKNNLQIISSLMNLQIRNVEELSAKAALRDCKGRIEAISMVHEKLYQSDDYAQVPFAEYAPTFVSNIFQAAGAGSGRIRSKMNVSPIKFPVDTAITVGLILNELITNAIKHAFPENREGCISVVLETIAGNRVKLQVSDNGVGIPETRREGSDSLGMQLIETLVNQLEGELSIEKNSGSRFIVIFSAAPA